MMMSRGNRIRGSIGGVAVVCLCAAAAVFAQSQTGSIAGVVRDTSGAVLPGVTVEASSPALIEKVRSVITDDKGNYKIIELRPGTYTVTFSLPGFSTVKREGLGLSVGFTANVNADLKVGGLEETVVVSGASPVVDVQNVRTQTVLSREILDTLPTGKTIGAFATLTLGVTGLSSPTVDVGGNKGENFLGYAVHGGRSSDGRTMIEGMDMNYGGTAAHRNQINQAIVQEVALQTRGMSADTENGGVVINYIPKDGGNQFKLYVAGNVSDKRLQSSNITDLQRSQGINEAAKIYHLYEIEGGLGGPIRKDRMWFYTAHEKQGSGEYAPGIYFNATQHTSFFYTPDFSKQKFNAYDIRDHSTRVTWQATGKQKVSAMSTVEWNCQCYKLSGIVDINRSPEASQHTYFTPDIEMGTWQYTRTNKLLLEAGAMHMRDKSKQVPIESVLPGDIEKIELTTNFKWGARMGDGGISAGSDYGDPTIQDRYPHRASVSYVTGSHAFKAGYQGRISEDSLHIGPEQFGVQPYSYQLRSNVPTQITEYATPLFQRAASQEVALFAQDQWTLSRATINAGVRFDAYKAWAPAAHGEAGMFRAAADYPADHPGFIAKDASPRLGLAYDLFGTGRTAVKASLGRYVGFAATAGPGGIAPPTNYSLLVLSSVTRVWTDTNGNLTPDCVLTNPALNGECGAIANSNFGLPVLSTTYDTEALRGWQKRNYNWQLNANVQHQLASDVAVTFGYYRTWYGNFTVTQNRSVTAADFDAYCVTVPTDARLSNSGQQVCGLYDVTPAKFGQVASFVTSAGAFGDPQEYYDGLDVNLNTRFGGRMLQGGMSFGRTVTDNCFQNTRPDITFPGTTAGTPRTDAFCHVEQPWSSSAQVKIAGVYPLPWNTQVSGTLQNINTFALQATNVFSNASIAPSLGRSLGSCRGAAVCTGTVSVPLLATNTEFGDRLTQLDLRLTKIVRMGGKRVQAMVDVYNALNASTNVNVNTAYGASWLKPLTIVSPRLVKFGGQLDW